MAQTQAMQQLHRVPEAVCMSLMADTKTTVHSNSLSWKDYGGTTGVTAADRLGCVRNW